MLYRIINNVPVMWVGEAIDGLRHSLDIEQLWTTQELLDVGLYIPVIPLAPTDTRVVSSEVVLVDGVPTYEYVTEPWSIVEERSLVECTKLQAKAALYEIGLLDSVEALIASGDFITQLAWKEAATFKRTSPLLVAMIKYITWPNGDAITEDDVDSLFARALELKF